MAYKLKSICLATVIGCGWSGSAAAQCSTATPAGGSTTLNCALDTATTLNTNTNPNNPATVAREQRFGNNITGRVTAGTDITGFGLIVAATGTQSINFENNGTITNSGTNPDPDLNILERGLQLRSNGGDITYTGNGSVSTTNAAVGLHLFTRDLGNLTVGSSAAPVTGNFSGRSAVSLNQAVVPGGTSPNAAVRNINAYFHGGTFTVNPSENVGVGIAINAQDSNVNLVMTGNSVISSANGVPGGGILINSLQVNSPASTTVNVATDARIGTAAAPMQTGIAVFNFLENLGITNVALTGTGSIFATQWGIRVDGSEAGSPVSISTAAGTGITVVPNGQSVDSAGIEVNAFLGGNVTIDVAGSIAGGDYGINARPENGRLDVTIRQGATVSGTRFGFNENRFGGTGPTNILVLGTLSSPQTAAQFTGTLQVGNGGTSGTLSGNVANGGVLIFNRSDASSYAGIVSGTGSLRSIGTGILTLGGASTYTGGTTVERGTLLVNGSIGGAMQVNSGATLGGAGSIGSAGVAGALAPGSGGIGTLTATGNVTFAAGSTFQVEVNEAGGSDRLTVAGTATLQGGTVSALFVGSQGNQCGSPITSTILTAQGGVTGTFSGVTANFAFLAPTLSYTATNVNLTLTRNAATFSQRGVTANQRSAADATEALRCGNPLFNAVVQLAALPAQSAFEQLSGEIHASAKGALFDDSRFVREALLSRREGRGAWASAYGSWGELDGDGNAAALDRKASGLFVGLDIPFGGSWWASLSGGRSRAEFDMRARSSRAEVESWHAGGMIGGRFEKLRVGAGGALASHSIDIRRSINFDGFNETPAADYDARTLQAFAEAAYSMPLGNGAEIEPFADLAWVQVETDGFAETGGAAALTGREESDSVVLTTLGARGRVRLGPLALTSSLGWRHAFSADAPEARLAFASNPGTLFSVTGTTVAEDSLAVEAGAELTLGGRARLGILYSGQLAGRASDHGARARLSIAF